MNRNRVETITDGIIAIAATIMVLKLGVPAASDWSGLQEIGHIFLAYVISFFMIYIVWSMHHDLFQKAAVLSRRAFLINGIWIFFLTLVPFTTAWVGEKPYEFLPEFLYPLNLLLWSAAFQWLRHQIRVDNTGIGKDETATPLMRILMYGCYILCMILSFIRPELSIYVIGAFTVVLFIWSFFSKKRNAVSDGEQEER